MEPIEIRAKSFEKAMELAVSQTGKSLDELIITCVQEPRLFKKGIYKISFEETKEEKTANNKKQEKQKNENKKLEKQQQNEKSNQNTNVKPNNQNIKPNNQNSKPNNQNKKPEAKFENKLEKEVKKQPQNEPQKEIKKEEKKQPQNLVEKEVKAKNDEPIIQINEDVKIVLENQEGTTTEETQLKVSPAELDHFVRNFIVEFAKAQGVDVEAEVQIRDGNKFYILNGEHAHKLIGYHGENLNAMQLIIAAVVSEKYSISTRILLDIEQYKAKREESLKVLARKTARKVIQTRRSQKLEPMNANERRIIHSELQSNQKVTTESHGTEPYRFVVIKLK